jgi:ferric-dicitrate binding protein FerR (iron transport regulator)
MPNINAKDLLDKYYAGLCTPKEEELVEAWFHKVNQTDDIQFSEAELEEIHHEMWEEIQSRNNKTPVRKLWYNIAAAASILLVISIGVYFLPHQLKKVNQIAQNKKNELLPGSEQATLILANGQKIILTKGLNGKLVQQNNALIAINTDHAVAYKATGDRSKIEYNTLSTKNGEQSPYPLILSDGTKIWLNAASSVTFPTAFSGKERVVTVTGEAYFDVVHNAKQPFKVKVKGQVIEDIGTQFNINAYDDEPAMKTTLIEGSVKISEGSSTRFLKPGQQAVALKDDHKLTVKNADIAEEIAWKNGLFFFKNADLQTVMRQLSRWYDVTIQYDGNISKRSFNGEFHRSLKASQLLDILRYYKVNFKIDGKKIIVKT